MSNNNKAMTRVVNTSRLASSDKVQSDSDQTTLQVSDDSRPNAPLHSPSLPSSPSRGIASSEEESVAELEDVSEGDCSSVEDYPLARLRGSDLLNNVASFVSKRLPTSRSPSAKKLRGTTIPAPSGMPAPSSVPAATKANTKKKGATIASSSGGIKQQQLPSLKIPVSPQSTIASASIKMATASTIKPGKINIAASEESPDGGGRRQKPLQSAADPASSSVSGPLNSLPSREDTTTQHSSSSMAQQQSSPQLCEFHRPRTLPKFKDPQCYMWTSSHEANCPSEDRSSSLVNVLLQPLPPNFDSETQLPPLEPDYKTLIRMSLWSVIDGHGGGCVATYASEVLLPHIAASISRALGCAIVDRGVCTVNGQLRDANALDLDGLIKTSDRSLGNPNSIHYRSPFERSDSEEEGDGGTNLSEAEDHAGARVAPGADRKQIPSLLFSERSVASSLLPGSEPGASVSSVKTSVKTAASNKGGLLGTHSPQEVAAITRAITESFLAVDEGWINSIDPVATHQTSCQTNGRWNSGACALVVFTIQRLDWTSVSEPDKEKELKEPEKNRGNDTSQNRDAARRRMLDYATRAKSASSISTISSTSSLTTEEAVNASGLESEITDDGEDDRSACADARRRGPYCSIARAASIPKESLISAPGGCSCHCYRAHDTILYTAHVGDCRAVMLGSAPPRTIKVRDSSTDHPDTTDDESSHHSSDETECLSSSDHDADTSDDEDIEVEDSSAAAAATSTPSYMTYMRRPARRQSRRRSVDDTAANVPFIALPPLEKEDNPSTVYFDLEGGGDYDRRRKPRKELSDSSTSSSETDEMMPLIYLPPVTRPIDLTTDHSAYNPAEVTAVLRRCNNAPRAISAGVGGGIKRVAGSLAVTRALGDAYLKTPLLSFLPYKSHAPYITARPEVNCRPVVKGADKVLILATDGVWERAGGEDVLRWVRNFYTERVAEAERRSNRRSNFATADRGGGGAPAAMEETAVVPASSLQEQQERQDDKNELDYSAQRKREQLQRSPSPPSKRRKRSGRRGCANQFGYYYGWSRRPNVSDVIVRRVLNKVRRARNISSLHALMSLPQGRARRSKHDDITSCVVDLSAFVS